MSIRPADIPERGRRRGQAIIETVVVMFFLCLIFFQVYEYASLLTAHTVLDYAAARAARARSVGFNDYMITKTVRVASMSTAGKCYTKTDENEDLTTAGLISRMGSYLECDNESETKGILDFAFWSGANLGWTCNDPGGDASELILRVWQRRPLYSNGDPVAPEVNDHVYNLTGEAQIEGHYPFYLQ